MLSCEVTLDVFQLHGGIHPSYDTLNGASDIGYEMKHYEKNYNKTEQGNIWCSKCSKIPIFQMTVGNWVSSCQRRPVWPFSFFFRGTMGKSIQRGKNMGDVWRKW
jgi:hypothetical protein